MKKTNIFIATLLMLCLFACKKESKGKSPGKTELLTTGTWKVTTYMEDWDGNGSQETDVLALFPSCTRDDFHTFLANKNLERNEGPTKCDPLDPQTDLTSWDLTTNETVLVLDGDPYKLESINSSSIVLRDNTASGYSIIFTKR
jgi:hypothetical protein